MVETLELQLSHARADLDEWESRERDWLQRRTDLREQMAAVGGAMRTALQ